MNIKPPKESKFIAELRKSIAGAATFKIHGDETMAGFPDLIVIVAGAVNFIETKVDFIGPKVTCRDLFRKLTPRQKATLQQIAQAGGRAFVAVQISPKEAYVIGFMGAIDLPDAFVVDICRQGQEDQLGKISISQVVEDFHILKKENGVWQGLEFLKEGETA